MAALLHAAARVAGRQPAAAARRPAGRRPLATAVVRRQTCAPAARHDAPSHARRLATFAERPLGKLVDESLDDDELKRAVRGAEAEALEDAFFSPDALSFLGIATFDDAALREGFDAVDEDGDGRLCRAELKNLFLRTCPKIGQRGAAFDVMVDNIMDELDADGNDAVSWTEFKSAFAVYYLTYLDRASLMDGSASARHA